MPFDPAALRDLLMRWSEINSGSNHLAGLERMREALIAELQTLPGIIVEAVALPGTTARAIRATVNPAASRRLLLSGHYDTVYGADDPFQTCTLLDPDTLRGPGVADMKGGLVVMVAALREFLSAERNDSAPANGSGGAARGPGSEGPRAGRPPLGLDILLTPDEETGSVASRALLDELAAARRHELVLIFEPARANGDLVRRRKGTGIFTLTCHGRAAHAGRDPGAGRNAILALAEVLPGVAALAQEIEGVSVNVGNIRGGGAVNIVPDFAEAQVNVRTTRVADEALVLERLGAVIAPINARDGFRLVVTGGFNRPPKEVSPAEEELFQLWRECARACGVSLSWQDVGGGSDGNILAVGGLPCLDGLGPVGDHLHSPDEYIRISSLEERAKVAVTFLRRIAAL